MHTLSIAACMILCFATFGGFRFLLFKHGITYTERYWWTAIYFLTASLIAAFIFWHDIRSLIFPVVPEALLLSATFLISLLFVIALFRSFIPAPDEYFRRNPDRYYLEMDPRRALSKSCDITAQQIYIAVIVVELYATGMSILHVTLWFALLFALLHIPLIASEWGRWPAWAFSGAVVVFSSVFPYLIITVHYGFVYTFMIHWTFYMVMAGIFWISHSRRPPMHMGALQKTP